MSTCGDGLIALNEACDDANTADADGCSGTCNIENGFDCTGEPSVCGLLGSCGLPIVAGNGFVFQAAALTTYGDDLDFEDATCAADNSDMSGKADLVFSVDLLAGDTLHVTDSGASDILMHVITGACDSATPCAASFDGINSAEVSPGLTYTSTTAQTVLVVVDSYSIADSALDVDLLFEVSACGDGTVITGESCDDGNTTAGDGCSDTCQTEAGFGCIGSPSVCAAATCSDPLVVTGSGVTFQAPAMTPFNDDLDFEHATCATDNSDATGKADLVFSVDLNAGDTLHVAESGGADVLMHVITGACDSTTPCAASFDGVGAAEITPGLIYNSPTTQTVLVIIDAWSASTSANSLNLLFEISPCGDGAVGAGEGCDDGNTTPGDGCNATCGLETGFLCEGAPSTCFSIVGCTTAACFLGPCTGGSIITATATGLPANIPDATPAGGVTMTIPVVGAGTVRSMAMGVDITHPWDSDVDIWLTGPNGGGQRDVCSDNGSDGDNFVDTFFRDGVATAVTSGTAPFTGVYRPESVFSFFTGQTVAGNWTVRVADDASGDLGSVTSTEIAFCVDP